MKEISGEVLDALQKEGKKIVVQVSAKWCSPCRILTPILEKVETEYPEIEFYKLDVDLNKDYVVKMGISSVPTTIYFRGDEIVNKSTGIKPLTYYRDIFDTIVE